MLKKTSAFLVLCLLVSVPIQANEAVPPKTHPDSSGWQDAFARDLSNANYTKGTWSFIGDVLTPTKDDAVWSNEEYGDAILDLEFKNAPATNSGVFVYATDTKDWVPNSVEIQLADDHSPKWANEGKTQRCAAIFGRLGPTHSAVKKPGEWNRMTITCQGPKIWVMLNGEMVTQMDMTKWTSAKTNPDGSEIPPWLYKPLSKLPTKGHIGLQGKHAGAPIYFRNLKIKALSAE